MNRNGRITLMVAMGLLITVLISINAYRTIQRLITMNNWVVHTHLVLNKTQRVLALLTNLDNDLRAFLLSDNPYFKIDFERNTHEMTEQLNRLNVLTADNPTQQKRVHTLDSLFQRKLDRSLALFKTDSIDNGKARLDSIGLFLSLSEPFQQALKEAESYENVLLDTRTTQSKRSAEQATINSLIGSMAALAMIVWAMYLLFQALKESNRLNKQLVDSEQQIKKFLEAVPVSVVVVNRDGKFYYANRAASTLVSTIHQHDSYADVLKSMQLFRYPGGQPYPIEERPTYRALRGETVRVDDMELRVDGRVIQVLGSSSPIYDADGVLQYVVSSSVDITEQIQSQIRLQEAKEMTEKAAKLKENFLANMSHEIRTPLNAMLGFSDLLEMTPLDKEQKEFVDYIRTAGKNLLTIVNDILDISKIEAGMIQFESIPFSIQPLILSLKTMLHASATDKDLYLLVKTDPTLPSTVLGDPTRLTQILLNLLSNAIKFTKAGGITVEITKKEATPKSVRVQFAIQDTGIGIEEDVLPHIFERFRQATNFTTRFYGGTGLGLNIVKSLIELQGGQISVESTPGKGSRFTMEITYQISPEQINLDKHHSSDVLEPDQNALHILIVEDNLMNQKLALQVLKRLGYRAKVAENGQQALDILEESKFDLVLMDIQMPVMDGYETTHHIRNRLKSDIPIIAMTAHALASEREVCLKAGMNDFIPKPFRMEDLHRMMRQYLPTTGATGTAFTPDQSIAAPTAGFSIEPLLSAIGNDMEFAGELLELYLNQTPGELDKIRQAQNESDLAEIGRLIHTQKAQTKMLGLNEATQLILDMEVLIKANKSPATVFPLVERYIIEVNKALLAIGSYVEATFKRAD